VTTTGTGDIVLLSTNDVSVRASGAVSVSSGASSTRVEDVDVDVVVARERIVARAYVVEFVRIDDAGDTRWWCVRGLVFGCDFPGWRGDGDE